jgi:hypothetical protein
LSIHGKNNGDLSPLTNATINIIDISRETTQPWTPMPAVLPVRNQLGSFDPYFDLSGSIWQ